LWRAFCAGASILSCHTGVSEDVRMRLAVATLFWGFTAHAFVIRTVARKLASGDTGIRGVARDRGVLAFAAGMLPVPAWLLVGAAPLFSAGEWWLPGVAVTCAGVALALASQRAMASTWRIGVAEGERTALVTRGPFRWMRNPFFTGMALIATGTTAASPTWAGAGATVLLFGTLVVQVRVVEEPHLVRMFGAEYLAYARCTGRFIPGVGVLSPERRSRARRRARPR
jgi:protein-S-isoprenylcysteine O-methyltransferase Ste14